MSDGEVVLKVGGRILSAVTFTCWRTMLIPAKFLRARPGWANSSPAGTNPSAVDIPNNSRPYHYGRLRVRNSTGYLQFW